MPVSRHPLPPLIRPVSIGFLQTDGMAYLLHQFKKAGAFLLTGIGREQRGAEDTLADRIRLPVVAEGVRDV